MGSQASSIFSNEFNFLVFPAPPPSYTGQESFVKYFQNQRQQSVPFLCIVAPEPILNLIYFHGNAEDIGYSRYFLEPLAKKINANIYAIEYPSYGHYKSKRTEISDTIKLNSLQFFEYLVHNSQRHSSLKVTRKNTVVFGRSIGTGGATYLASQKQLNNLILMSPFTDISSLAAEILKYSNNIVKCHFDNMKEIENYNGRLLVIHGEKDEVINVSHGRKLFNYYLQKNKNCMNDKKCHSLFPKYMTHNIYNEDEDIYEPIAEFVKNININQEPSQEIKQRPGPYWAL